MQNTFPHVAGALGAEIAEKLVEQKFIIQSRNDRSVAITRSGISFFVDTLKFNPSFFHDAVDVRRFEYRGRKDTSYIKPDARGYKVSADKIIKP